MIILLSVAPAKGSGYHYRAGPHRLVDATSPIKAQTRYVLNVQRAILEAGGLSLGDVVKSEVFLLSAQDITGLDEVWQE